MSQNTRKIILKEAEISQNEGESAEDFAVRTEYVKTAPQSFNFSGNLTTIPGEVLEVSEVKARLAVESGKFDYAPETIKKVEEEVAVNTGTLTETFPHAEKLRSVKEPITTLEELNAASDETILGIEGIGEKGLKQIRKAAETLGGVN